MGVSVKRLQQYKHDDSRTTMKFLTVAEDWLARVEGTGELPRTRDMVLKALKSYRFFPENKAKEAFKFLMED